MSDPNEFENELAIFGAEHETAQQYFFSYVSLRGIAASNGDVLKSMNATPLFWLTVESAMLLSAFIALGRIFDQKSDHNLDRLIGAASKQIATFSREALAARRRAEGRPVDETELVVRNAYEPSAADFRSLRNEIRERRKIYEAKYRDVRHKVFAHRKVADTGEANALLQGTTVDETKALFAFLDALEKALWHLLHSGRKPTLVIKPFDLPPTKTAQLRSGEKIYQEVSAVLQQIARQA